MLNQITGKFLMKISMKIATDVLILSCIVSPLG